MSQAIETALANLHTGDRAVLRAIDDVQLQIALMNMGLVPGDVIEVSDVALQGCPMAIRVNGTKIALRRAMAVHVIVQRIQ